MHVSNEAILEEYTLFSIEIPDDQVSYVASEHLPTNWRHDPAPLSTMELGTGWLQSGEGAALVLPSTIIPMENNAILNPSDVNFQQYLQSVVALPFIFDSRLIK